MGTRAGPLASSVRDEGARQDVSIISWRCHIERRPQRPSKRIDSTRRFARLSTTFSRRSRIESVTTYSSTRSSSCSSGASTCPRGHSKCTSAGRQSRAGILPRSSTPPSLHAVEPTPYQPGFDSEGVQGDHRLRTPAPPEIVGLPGCRTALSANPQEARRRLLMGADHRRPSRRSAKLLRADLDVVPGAVREARAALHDAQPGGTGGPSGSHKAVGSPAETISGSTRQAPYRCRPFGSRSRSSPGGSCPSSSRPGEGAKGS